MSIEFIVRRATKQDIPRILVLFYQEYVEERSDTWVGFDYSHDSMNMALEAITSDERFGFLLVAEDSLQRLLGAILMEVGRPVFNLGNYFYNEAAWYVLPEFRGMGVGRKLAEIACDEAKRLGANAIAFGRPMIDGFDKLHDFYVKNGFKPGQAMYFKDLRIGRDKP